MDAEDEAMKYYRELYKTNWDEYKNLMKMKKKLDWKKQKWKMLKL